MSTSSLLKPLLVANNNVPRRVSKRVKEKPKKMTVQMPWQPWNGKLAPLWALSLPAQVRKVAIVLHLMSSPRPLSTRMLLILTWMVKNRTILEKR